MSDAPARRDQEPALEIAPPRARRRRAAAFQAATLAALALFVALAVLARRTPYFAADLAATRALQSVDHPAFAALMVAVSWIGFLPQLALIGLAVAAALLAAGLRFEALALVVAGVAGAVTSLVKAVVLRPRPSAELVEVMSVLGSPSFPSGHVVIVTAFCGFLMFLAFTLLQPSWLRRTLLALLGALVLLMGPSRVYLGQHWPSDVLGAYVLGSLWLAATVAFYRWAKPRFGGRQPRAGESGRG